MKKNLLYMVVVLVLLSGCLFLINKQMDHIEEKEKVKSNNTNFNLKILKEVNKNNKSNYLISPYSIEIALSMVKDGSTGTTHKEIDAVIPKRSIRVLDAENRISLANALFIKNEYSKDIKKNFISDIKRKYDGEIIYDDFRTPDVINSWADEKTNHMIDKILDNISADFILGIANALAIDVEWNMPFECNNTTQETFISPSGKMDIEGMHATFNNAEYIMTDDVKGIILPYKTYKNSKNEDVNLEFVALLPNEDLNKYIDDLTDESLSNTINSKKSLSKNERVRLMLPRFEYDYEIEKFIQILKNIGINKAFNPGAEFNNITDIPSYITTAIHKTHISLNEKGTKAAAVTFFALEKSTAMPIEKNYIDITFNKPFIYLIRDKDSSELLFIGTVYTPNKYQGSTCSSIGE